MIAKQTGFTLIELMVAVGVFGLVIVFALPNFNRMMVNNQASNLGMETITAINYARSEAVKRASRVSICPANPNEDTCLTSSDWNKGWMMFVDTATSDSAATPVVGTIIKRWNSFSVRDQISVKSGSTEVNFLRFTATGALGWKDNNSRVITTYTQKCKGTNQSEITVNVAGMVRSTKIACP
jgi:type IV fimbrial biogenesis protein FimT